MITQSENISLRDGLIALSVVALWGLHVVVIRIGALEIPPLLLLSIRFAIVTAVAAFFFTKLPKEKIKNIAIYTVFYLVLHLGTIFVGLKYISASTGGLILQTEVPFAILLGWLLLGEKFGLKTMLGLLLAFAGVLIIIYQPGGAQIEGFTYLGAFLLLASSFFWAVGAIRMRNIEGIDFWTMTFYSHIIALPFVIGLTAIFESDHWNAVMNANHLTLGIVLFYQVVLMTICLYTWKNLMVRNRAYQVTVFMLLQPIFSVVFGAMILGESLGVKTLIGGGVALLGVVVVTMRKMQKAQKMEIPGE